MLQRIPNTVQCTYSNSAQWTYQGVCHNPKHIHEIVNHQVSIITNYEGKVHISHAPHPPIGLAHAIGGCIDYDSEQQKQRLYI